MSHFTVLVIGDNVDEQLAPFHEFECTGNDDKYVQDIDETESMRAEYEAETRNMIRLPDGSLKNPYENEFYRDPTPEEEASHGLGRSGLGGSGSGGGISWDSRDWGDGRGYRAKVHFIPEGAEKVEVPLTEVYTFKEFLTDWHGKKVLRVGQEKTEEHKYGYALVDENDNVIRVIDRTNPNRKWDWYVIGGRWAGFFLPKAGRSGNVGRSGAFDNKPEPGWVDQIRKGDIDIDGMQSDAVNRAASLYDRVHAVIRGREVFGWAHVRDVMFKDDLNAAREFYNNQDVVQDLRNAEDRDLVWLTLDDFLVTRDEYLQSAKDGALSTFAVLKDGQWYERGEMGWWGAVSNEKDGNEWTREFAKMFDAIPDDTLVTVVDCHI